MYILIIGGSEDYTINRICVNDSISNNVIRISYKHAQEMGVFDTINIECDFLIDKIITRR